MFFLSYKQKKINNDNNNITTADPDGCRRFSGSGYKNEATIKAGEWIFFCSFPFFSFSSGGEEKRLRRFLDERGLKKLTPALSLRKPSPKKPNVTAGFVGAESELVAAGGDGGRLYLFDARTSQLRHRIRTDSHTCNAFREHPVAPLHLACVGIDDSVKLLAPVGGRRRRKGGRGGRRPEGGRDGGGGEQEIGGGSSESSESSSSSSSSSEDGGNNGGQSSDSGSPEEEQEGAAQERAARFSTQRGRGLEGSRGLALMLRLGELGIPPPRGLLEELLAREQREGAGEEGGGEE